MGIPGGKTESRPCNNVTIKKRCQETETMLKVAVKKDIWLKEYALPFSDVRRFEITASF